MNVIRRLLALQPARIGAAAAAVYAAAAMIYHLATHTGVLHTDVLLAAATAVWNLWTSFKVTPLERPRDRHGRPLVIQGHVEPPGR